MKKNLFAILFLLFASTIYSQSVGPLSPQSASYSAFGCLACPGVAWNNLQNLAAADHLYAEVGLSMFPNCFQGTCFYSRILFAYDFGFSIPPGAIITGIEAQVLRMSTVSAGVMDSSVQLYTGSPVGTNHAQPNNWTPNLAAVNYGSSSDLWGYTLTPDSVNNSSFGLSLQVVNKNSTVSFVTASIDQIQMTVYYTMGTGIYSQTNSVIPVAIDYNPATHSLHLSSTVEKCSGIYIYDASGKKYGVELTPGNARTMELPSMPAGIYCVVMNTPEKIYTRKIVITD